MRQNPVSTGDPRLIVDTQINTSRREKNKMESKENTEKKIITKKWGYWFETLQFISFQENLKEL